LCENAEHAQPPIKCAKKMENMAEVEKVSAQFSMFTTEEDEELWDAMLI
jgi:hypothetical protein